MAKTDEMVTKLEEFIITKVKSFGEQTSPEEILALAELVRAVTVCKKVNNLTVI